MSHPGAVITFAADIAIWGTSLWVKEDDGWGESDPGSVVAEYGDHYLTRRYPSWDTMGHSGWIGNDGPAPLWWSLPWVHVQNKAQGTTWETELVHLADEFAIPSNRLPEGGMRDVGDLWMINHPSEDGRDAPRTHMAALAWKRLVPGGGVRRSPMGERQVVVTDVETFLRLVRYAQMCEPGLSMVVEAKAAERVSVTTVLAKTRAKLAAWVQKQPVFGP